MRFIEKTIIYFTAVILFVILLSCENLHLIQYGKSGIYSARSKETIQKSTSMDLFSDLIKENPLETVQKEYGQSFSEYLSSIKDAEYKNAIINDRSAEEALYYFYTKGYLDVLFQKKITPSGIIKLYDILKDKKEETTKDYIENSSDKKNNNSAALILQSNLLDWDVALSAYICQEFNIPYFIISNRDGSYINSSGNDLKLTLKREDSAKKVTSPMYYLISSTYRELQFAREYGDTYRVKTDMTKKEILDFLGGMLKKYNTVYFFINTHADKSMTIFSSGSIEYINAEDIFNVLKIAEGPINFKIISGHCYDHIETELEKKLKNTNDIEYSFLTASSVKAWEGDLLESIIYSNDGIVTIDELKNICKGKGHVYKTVSEWGESFYIFKSDSPPYIMDICYDGRGYCDIELRTNSQDLSIFYYRPDYFRN